VNDQRGEPCKLTICAGEKRKRGEDVFPPKGKDQEARHGTKLLIRNRSQELPNGGGKTAGGEKRKMWEEQHGLCQQKKPEE